MAANSELAVLETFTREPAPIEARRAELAAALESLIK